MTYTLWLSDYLTIWLFTYWPHDIQSLTVDEYVRSYLNVSNFIGVKYDWIFLDAAHDYIPSNASMTHVPTPSIPNSFFSLHTHFYLLSIHKSCRFPPSHHVYIGWQSRERGNKPLIFTNTERGNQTLIFHTYWEAIKHSFQSPQSPSHFHILPISSHLFTHYLLHHSNSGIPRPTIPYHTIQYRQLYYNTYTTLTYVGSPMLSPREGKYTPTSC